MIEKFKAFKAVSTREILDKTNEIIDLLEKKFPEEFEPELKPCPFCGGRGKIMRHGNGAYKVQCEKCGARTAKVVIQPWHSTKFVTQGKAAKEWNQRVEDNVPVDLG